MKKEIIGIGKMELPHNSMKKEEKKVKCLNCGRELESIKDPIAKKKTGYLWQCSKCMSKNLIISSG